MAKETTYYGTGRRKEAVARVWIKPGTGKFEVVNRASSNKVRDLDGYFQKDTLKMLVMEPMEVTKTVDQFDVFANVRGGGVSGQAGALRHGITRALMEFNIEFRGSLKQGGFVTRDPRATERKKYGRKKARKRFQFSKR